MLELKQFRYGADNLGYLLHGVEEALAVDGGAAEEILAVVSARGLRLTTVANTHDHGDHTCGDRRLLAASGAGRLTFADLPDGATIEIDGQSVEVLHTPGHTLDSVCFRAGDILLTGDTIFNGTIGNNFSGDSAAFLASVKRVLALPDATRIYAGHDYVHMALAFARWLEPANPALDPFLRRYDAAHVVSTLAEEREVNPYFRFNAGPVVAALEQRGLPCATEGERWESLMSLE